MVLFFPICYPYLSFSSALLKTFLYKFVYRNPNSNFKPMIDNFSGRLFDSAQKIRNLSTMSLQFWGENPRGRWRVWLRNVAPDPKHNGNFFIIQSFSQLFHKLRIKHDNDIGFIKAFLITYWQAVGPF